MDSGPVVFIISAPSGSGKSTIVRKLLDGDGKLLFSISYTTRRPRGTEKHGESYHYISREEFERRISSDEFLEWAKVFENYYGTHQGYLDKARSTGCDLVLDIDVQGARQLMKKCPDAVSVFILAPSRAILEQRLRARSEDAEEVIQRRLREAAEEIRNLDAYQYVLINDEVDEAVRTLESIVRAERSRRERMAERVKPIRESFLNKAEEASK